MKKTMTFIIAAAMSAAVLAGCGNDAAGSSSSSASSSSASSEASSVSTASSGSQEEEDLEYVSGDFTFDECVELPNYKGLKLTKEVTKITDDMIDSYYSSRMTAETLTDPDAKIEEGDIVNTDFEAKFGDGDYGDPQGTDFNVTIGSGTTIDGFEDGLKGHKVGDEVYLDLKFPDDYYSADYAGKDVTFHITVKEIKRMPEPSDEWVNTYTNGEYTTVKDYDVYIKDYLEELALKDAKTSLRQSAWQEVFQSAKFKKLPEEYINEGKEAIEEQVESAMSNYGIETKEEYIEQSGMTQEQYDEYVKSYSESYAKSKLIVYAIWEKEGLSEDDKLYKDALKELVDAASSTEEDMIEQYGEDNVRDYCRSMAVNDYIIENADVKEVEVDG